MKVILFFLISTFTILAQDFIPHLEQLQQNVIDKMRDNKIKRMEAVSYQADADFKPLSDKFYYTYNYEYNADGQIIFVDYFNVEQDLRIETSYAYDDNGTLESIVVTETSGATQSTPVVTHTTFWATVTAGKIEQMSKYVAGNLTNLYIFNYAHDMILSTILDTVIDVQSGVENTLYTFDMRGNVLSKISPNSSTYYTYDERGNCISENMDISGSKYETLSEYDANGNLTGVTVNGNAFVMNWIFHNDAAGLTQNSYSTYYTPGEGTSNYEWTTYIYTKH